jgi:hypothetical protein
MGIDRPRVPSGKRRQHKSKPALASSRADADAGVADALEEIQRVLDTPLAELVESDEERAAGQRLTREAVAVPAMVRLRKLVAFVGDRRPATQTGNLKAPDAVAVARLLGARDDAQRVRSMDDLPDVAHVFRWAIAAEPARPRSWPDLTRATWSATPSPPGSRPRSRCLSTACSTVSGEDGASVP